MVSNAIGMRRGEYKVEISSRLAVGGVVCAPAVMTVLSGTAEDQEKEVD
jgi:hypothetical protein